MRIIFMGTPDFALSSLEKLIEAGHDVCAVVTQPDKPKGRGKKLSMSPVKELAESKGIAVLQPEKVRTQEFVDRLRSFEPDLFVTAAYGRILTKDVLDVPKLGCINVHASLLPKLRGAGPIQWAIINGENVTGITTMFTDVGLDTGDMLLKEEVKIEHDMTVEELHDILAEVGAKLLVETLNKLEKGTLERISQDDDKSTYAPMIKKEHGKIDWNKPAAEIYNLIRGVNPWPGAFTNYQGERMRIWKSIIEERPSKGVKPGTIISANKEGILVAAKDNLLLVVEIQFDSGRKMNIAEYLCGHKIVEGEVLGKED